MNLSPADIDRIVAEVVRRLRAMSAASNDRGRESLAKKDSANHNDSTRQRLPTPAAELQLSDRVITLSALKGRLDGVNKLVVSSRAVVTPAVKDELKQRGITWARS